MHLLLSFSIARRNDSMAIDGDPLLVELTHLRDDQSSVIEGVRDTSIRVVLSASVGELMSGVQLKIRS